MESTQQQYAPFTMVQRVIMNVVTEEGEEDVTVEEMHFHPLLFGGDQFTEKPSRSYLLQCEPLAPHVAAPDRAQAELCPSKVSTPMLYGRRQLLTDFQYAAFTNRHKSQQY